MLALNLTLSLTPEWEGGESLAHKEVSELYQLEWDRIRFNVFVLVKMGAGPAPPRG